MPASRKSPTFKIGLLFFAGLTVLGAATVKIGHYDWLHESHTLKVWFKNVGGLKEGDPVRVSGLELGRVDRLDLQRPEKGAVTLENGEQKVGGVIVTLAMSNDLELRRGYTISVEMSSLVGGRHIAIDQGSGAPGVDTKANLLGAAPESAIDQMGEIMKENRDNVKVFVANLKDISDTLKSGQGTIGKLLHDDTLYNEARDAMAEVRQAVTELKKAGDVITKAGDVIGKVRDQVDKGEGTLAKLLMSNDVYDSLKSSADKLSEILAKAERGEGTVGKLLNDPSIYDDAKSLMNQMKDAVASVQKVVDAINRGEGTAGKLLHDDKLANDLATTVADVKEVAASMKSIAGKIDKGEGTLGKLVNESGIYDKAESVMGSLDKTIGKVGGVKTMVGVGSRYYTKDHLFAPYGQMQIWPSEDRYFEIRGEGWIASDRTGWEFPEEYKRNQSKVFIEPTVLAGWTFMDNRLDLAAGYLEGRVGARAKYRFTIPGIEHDVTAVAEVRQAWTDPDKLDERAGKLMTRFYLETKVWKWFHVQAGVSRTFHNPEFFVGASFEYEDEDIRTLVSLIGLAK